MFETVFSSATGFGLMSVAIVAISAGLVALFPGPVKASKGFLSALASGLIIALSLLHLVPEALNGAEAAAPALLAGFMTGALVTILVNGQSGHAGRVGLIAVAAIALHAALDGFVVATSFEAGADSGRAAGVGILGHKVPIAVVTFGVLVGWGYRSVVALALTVLAVGVSTSVGIMLAGAALHGLSAEAIGLAFGFSAGLLLYAGAGPLFAEARKTARQVSVLALAMGVGIAVLMEQLSPHDHGGNAMAGVDDHDYDHDHAHDTKPRFR